jgi:hypothetical protein
MPSGLPLEPDAAEHERAVRHLEALLRRSAASPAR